MRYRISKYKHLHSNRFRYLSSSIPLVCASGLLVVLGMMINPVGSLSNTSYAYDSGPDGDSGTSGSTTTTPTVELSVASTNLIKPSTTSNINYISTGLTVTALNTDSYGIYVQSTNGSSNLTNNGTTISGVGNNVSTTNFGTNTWGYSVADGTVGEADLPTLTYSTIPTSASSAAKSGTTAEAKPFTLAFAAKFADSATPGHYNGNVLVSVAANPGEIPILYSITYNANGSTGGTIPTEQMAYSTDDEYTFTTSNGEGLLKTGFGLAGWSESQNATEAQYKLGATIKLSATTPNKTLYAVWKVPTTYKVTYNANGGSSTAPSAQSANSVGPSYSFTVSGQGTLSKPNYRFAGWSENADATTVQYKPGSTIRLTSSSPEKTLYAIWAYAHTINMQDFTSANCSAYMDGESKQLTDTRDNKTYWVTKLADGNCWMTQNLDYDDPNSTKITNPSSWTSTSATYRAYYDPGEKIVSGSSLIAATSSTDRHLLVGNYYSWESATNGTGSATGADNRIASGSICPSGWVLPNADGTRTTNGSFGKLLYAYSGDSGSWSSIIHVNNIFYKEPLYFVPGGSIESALLSPGGRAEYWSSRHAGHAGMATYLDINDSYVNSFVGAEMYRGYSVRCLVMGN